MLWSPDLTARKTVLCVLSFDCEDGAGRDPFKFDTTQHGPLAGFRFEF